MNEKLPADEAKNWEHRPLDQPGWKKIHKIRIREGAPGKKCKERSQSPQEMRNTRNKTS